MVMDWRTKTLIQEAILNECRLIPRTKRELFQVLRDSERFDLCWMADEKLNRQVKHLVRNGRLKVIRFKQDKKNYYLRV